MVFRRMILGAIALLSPFLVAGDGIPAADKPPKLGILLTDGSLIIGVPSSTSVKVTTSFAELDLPFDRIVRIELHDDSSSTVALRNGDKISGEMKTRQFELSTIFGAATVNAEHIKAIDCIAPVSLPAALANSLILHYSFDADGDDKVADASGKDHNGVVHGAKWVRDPDKGGAYEFDGKDDWIEISPDFSAGDGSFSVSVWVKAEDFRNKYGHILGSHVTHGRAEWGLEKLDGANRMAWWVADNAKHVHTDSDVLLPDVWYHFAGVCDGTDITLYANGKKVSSAPQATPKMADRGAISSSIGVHPKLKLEADRYWKGRIDDLMVFNRALSAEEIKQVYDAQK